MMRFLFKQPQAKRFDFKPRYYNETKERLNARVEAIKREMEVEGLRSRMQNNWRREDVKKANRSSNRNVFIIVGILVIIAFLILK
jgi:preprotein translocase subunit Sec63